MIDTTKSISKVTYDGTNMSLATQTKTVTPTTSEQVIVGDDGYNLSSVTVKAVTKDIDENIQPNNIKQGVSILGVEGNVAPDKPDQSKIVNPTTSQQLITADIGYELAQVTVNAVTSDIDDNIQSGNIKQGITILGINGSLIPDKPDQTKTVTPTTEEQIITADNGFELASVTVNAVTSSIDENIIPENIKEGVDILGVSGTFVGEGGGDSGGQYLVQVIDYDGTVLKSDHLDTGATFTLPDAPTNHEKLVFQEWSSPVIITDNAITVENSDITIGATYKTASGLTEFDIELTKASGLDVVCNMVGNKNWGDGTTNSETSHIYTNYGKYTITCDGTSVSNNIFSASHSSKNYYCSEIRIGEGVINLGSRVFSYCSALRNIAIPNNGISNIKDATFTNCYLLNSIVIPNGVTRIGYQAFSACSSLNSIVIPNGVTSIDSSVFLTCSSLNSISMPNSVTSIGSQTFMTCSSLNSIVMPNSVTDIRDNTFSSCYSLVKFDFTNSTSVPALSNTTAFSSINGIYKIYVPDALYDDWIVATNWVTYADYIYKASEMED